MIYWTIMASQESTETVQKCKNSSIILVGVGRNEVYLSVIEKKYNKLLANIWKTKSKS